MSYAFMLDVEGHQVTDIERQLLAHPLVGAVLLFTRNYANKQQLMQLIQTIKSINPSLFFAIDHEGGYVQRLQRHDFRSIPSARVLGDLYDINADFGLNAARLYGKTMAADLLSCGIDVSLAPILDLDGASLVIGGLDRAFHANPENVVAIATAFIEGMHAAGMPCIGKHFPGHGSFQADSHLEKPVYEIKWSDLESTDLKPFKQLIQQNKLNAIMPAHVTYPCIDADYPAGFSSIWLKTILREQLGFSGLILSDCISMAGADIGDLRQRAEQAFHAGCDMVIVANQPRARVLELLDAVNTPTHKTDYLHNFQQSIQTLRNQANVNYPNDSAQSTLHVSRPSSIIANELNLTQSV